MHPRTVGRLCQTPIDFNSAFHRMKPSRCDRYRRAAREAEGVGANESNAPQRSHHANAFTLIELLVVIAIIAILVGLFFPAFSAVQNQARKAQAKNDLTQIVNAVNAYYTEYGQVSAGITTDTIYGPGGTQLQMRSIYTNFADALAANGIVSSTLPLTHARSFLFPHPMQRTQLAPDQESERQTGQWHTDPWGTPLR